MARKPEEISVEMSGQLQAALLQDGILIDPSTWSSANRLKHLVDVWAYQAANLERLFDNHYADTNSIVKELKPPSKNWYKNLLLNYQYGFPLIERTDKFDNTGYSVQEIEDSKVIKHVAVIKQINVYGRVKLRLKIAGSNGTDLVQIGNDVVLALTEYLDSVAAPAGDNYEVEGRPADNIKMKWRVYYDPLILNGQGGRLDGTASQPVRDAIKSFLKNGITEFSGTYFLIEHQDWVQLVPGVKIPEIKECFANYGNTAFVPVTTDYKPDGGWIRFANDNDLEIEYIPINEL
jgi:hypothetical protein